MRRFNISVNGKAYDVAVEELGAGAPAAAPVAAPAAPVAPVAPAAPAAPVAAGAGEKIVAPMPGTIIAVKVNVGDTVKKNQPIIVLEAMKMENDVVSPCDGKVSSITVKKGDGVEANAVLATIE